MSNLKVGPAGQLYDPVTGAYVGHLDEDGAERTVLTATTSDQGLAFDAARARDIRVAALAGDLDLITWPAFDLDVMGSVSGVPSCGYGTPLEKRIPAYNSAPQMTADGLVFGGNAELQTAAIGGNVTFVSETELPAGASGSVAGRGFTCTGLARLPDGKWVVGNHGKANAAAAFAPSVVILTADMASIYAEFTIASIDPAATLDSVQGVAVNSTGNILVSQKATKKIYEITPAGELVTTLTVLAVVNALGFNSLTGNVLYADDGNQIRNVHPTTGAAVSASKSVESGPIDKIQFDPTLNGVWYTSGTNGVDGKLGFFSFASQTTTHMLTLPGADAIEGCYVSGRNVYVCNDALYHSGASLSNAIRRYDVDWDPPLTASSTLLVSGVWKRNGPRPAATTAVVTVGNSLFNTAGVGGFGILWRSSSEAIIARSGGSSADVLPNFTDATLTEFALWSFLFDAAADTCLIRKNGVQVASLAMTGAIDVPAARLCVGAALGNSAIGHDAALMSNTTFRSLVVARNGFSRIEEIEAAIAVQARRTDLVPRSNRYRPR